VDCALHHSALPLADIAERVGTNVAYLRAAASQYDETHQLQARLIVPITVATGNFALLDFMERMVGRVAVRLPDVDVADVDLFAMSARLVKEVGDTLDAVRAAVADGRITAEEVDRIDCEVHQMHQAAAALEAVVRCLAERRDGAA
jgi:hypothetical protein